MTLSSIIQIISQVTDNCIGDIIDHIDGSEYSNKEQVVVDFVLYLLCEVECVNPNINKSTMRKLNKIRDQLVAISKEL